MKLKKFDFFMIWDWYKHHIDDTGIHQMSLQNKPFLMVFLSIYENLLSNNWFLLYVWWKRIGSFLGYFTWYLRQITKRKRRRNCHCKYLIIRKRIDKYSLFLGHIIYKNIYQTREKWILINIGKMHEICLKINERGYHKT